MCVCVRVSVYVCVCVCVCIMNNRVHTTETGVYHFSENSDNMLHSIEPNCLFYIIHINL